MLETRLLGFFAKRIMLSNVFSDNKMEALAERTDTSACSARRSFTSEIFCALSCLIFMVQMEISQQLQYCSLQNVMNFSQNRHPHFYSSHNMPNFTFSLNTVHTCQI